MRKFAFGLLLSATLTAPSSAQQTDQAEILKQLEHLRAAVQQQANDDSGAVLSSNPSRSVTIGVAHQPAAAEPAKPPYVIRAYDLADLFSIAPDARAVDWISETSQPLLPANGGQSSGVAYGGMGGGMFSVLDAQTELGASPEDLIDLLKSVTDGQWDEAEESIYQLGGTLVVRATENSQRQIESLLDLLSERWNSKVVMQTQLDFVYLNATESQKLRQAMENKDASVQQSWSLAAWDEFRNQLPSESRPTSHQARLTGFNGQRLAWTSGEQHRVVADVHTGKKGRLESLNLNHPHYGIVCESRTTISRNKDIATLNVSARLLREGAKDVQSTVEPFPGIPIDRQDTVGQSLAVSTRIPLDTVSLIAIGTDTEFEPAWQLHIFASIHEVK
jgi:hypothetical protein